jgi:hypothetical protein
MVEDDSSGLEQPSALCDVFGVPQTPSQDVTFQTILLVITPLFICLSSYLCVVSLSLLQLYLGVGVYLSFYYATFILIILYDTLQR